jgi:hypothetical protein
MLRDDALATQYERLGLSAEARAVVEHVAAVRQLDLDVMPA